ncbi:STAS domain-containing protein [Micromonospora sp. CPCC 206171]|uniref:STAS domain-containing protein n=1 Tax=Micromonospora sp. CPCC 206171 TaxID=3122405 RepID=UPI003FA6112B
MSTAHLISELTEQAIAQRPAQLFLDRSRVTFFSAHGISALLRTQRAAADAEVTLILRDCAPCVTYLLAATGTNGRRREVRAGPPHSSTGSSGSCAAVKAYPADSKAANPKPTAAPKSMPSRIDLPGTSLHGRGESPSTRVSSGARHGPGAASMR